MFFMTRTLIFLSNLIIFLYLYLLKKNDCECSKSYKREFILYFTLSYIFIIISFITFPKFFRKNNIIGTLLKLYLGIFLIVNAYMVYTYSESLDKNKCKCSDNLGRDIMRIYNVFYIFLMTLLFILVLSEYIKNADKLKDYNCANNKIINISIIKKI